MYSYDDSRRGGTAPTSNAQGLGSTAPSRRSYDGNNGNLNAGIVSPESEFEDRVSRLSVGGAVERGDLGSGPSFASNSGSSVMKRNLAVPTPRRPVTRQIGTNNSIDAVDDLNRALKHDRFRAASTSYSDDLNDDDTRHPHRVVKKSGWMSREPGSPVSRSSKKVVNNVENEVCRSRCISSKCVPP